MASKGFRSVRARSMVIAIATALAASMARAETISVPPCGSTPGTTTGSYSGLAIVTVSGSLVITPDNPDQDAFFNFNREQLFHTGQPQPRHVPLQPRQRRHLPLRLRVPLHQ